MKMPSTKEELFKMIDRHLKVADRKELALADNLSDYHFCLGMWIRNRFIYPSNGEVYKLISPGLFVPVADVASEEILEEYQKYLQDIYITSASK